MTWDEYQIGVLGGVVFVLLPVATSWLLLLNVLEILGMVALFLFVLETFYIYVYIISGCLREKKKKWMQYPAP